jgi:hypothetical protein
MISTLMGYRRGEASLEALEDAGGVGVSLVSEINSSDIKAHLFVDIFANNFKFMVCRQIHQLK